MYSYKLLIRRIVKPISAMFVKKDEFGLTVEQRVFMVSWAKESDWGYDQAMRLAIMGHDLTFDQFDSLMAQNGIQRRRCVLL